MLFRKEIEIFFISPAAEVADICIAYSKGSQADVQVCFVKKTVGLSDPERLKHRTNDEIPAGVYSCSSWWSGIIV